MIDTEALRKKVIDLAIQGKLTEQLPSDGDAETLYVQIQEEKAKLIKEGKIKKDKPSADISEEEILFNIPSNWKWVHLNEIAVSSLGKTLNKSTDKGELCRYLCSINIHWDEIILETVKTARFEEDEKEKYRLCKNDLLICEGGDSGRCAIWESDEEMYYQNALHRVRFFCNINPKLYCYIIEFYKKSGIIAFFSKGIGIQHLVQFSLNAMWLPLPPLREQERIVDKLKAVMDVIDIIDSLQKKYCSNIEVLKNKIIDAGIRGKLTEQLPEDGDAETLYTQIQEEKARLIKEGKIKKEKPLPDITEGEIPFEIPKNWKWVRLGDLSERIQYGYNAPAKQVGRIKMVRISDIHDGKVRWDEVPYCDIDDKDIKDYLLKENDILFARTGGTVGKSYIVSEIKEDAIYAGYLIRTSYSSGIYAVYMKYFMESTLYWKQLQNGTIATAQPNCNGKTLAKMMVPFPPYDEQKRISNQISRVLNQIGI